MPDYSPWPDNSSTFHVPTSEPVNSERMTDDPEFQSLRRAQQHFGLWATVLSVGGFLLYVLLSSFAPGVMNTPVTGRLTLGLVLGLGQFLVMGVTVWAYVRYMRDRVDPSARSFRSRLQQRESAARRRAGVPRARTGRGLGGTRGFGSW